MSEPEKPYIIVQGRPGESLWPQGIVVVDSYDTDREAARAARLRANAEGKPYRVLYTIEASFHEPGNLQVLEGEGLNPMSDADREENRAGIREARKAGKL
jgi:hypothetical protein